MSQQLGLFDLSGRYESPPKLGDPIEKINAVINFEIFPASIETGLCFPYGSKRGLPP